MRDTPLPYGKQWIDEDDIAAVAGVLRSDFITCGPKITELERVLCDYTGAAHAVALNSGTAALHAAVRAAGIGAGDEVITTPLTFMASANCALYEGAVPVFADIDEETYNIDPARIEEKITPRTRAVVAVDYAGEVVDADAIRALCDAHRLVFIEDAAHAIGSKHRGRMTGSYADLTCFSFHPVKTVTAGEGGALLCDDGERAYRAELFRSHGMEHDASRMTQMTAEQAKEEPWYYEQQMLGYNYRMPDINAALLISQMQKIDRFIARRKEIAAKYDAAFSGMRGILLQKRAPWSDAARHLYVIRLDTQALSCTRGEFYHALRDMRIYSQIHYVPVYYFPEYQRRGYGRGLCPVAERVYDSILSIPLFPKMEDRDADDVIEAVETLCRKYRR